MSKSSARSVIRLRGVRHNNLKNFDLDLPLNRLIVITGLSGSGKSSLAFDTLFAEGQRRYIETFSPYARQFFDRMDKPQVDSIEGIPPAIAIEQRNAVRTTRSTVGTMTEICDHMKVLWPCVAQLRCRECGRPVRKDSPQQIWEEVRSVPLRPTAAAANSERIEDENEGRGVFKEVLVTFDVPLSEKLSLEESLALVSKQGYQRLLLEGQVVRVEEMASGIRHPASGIRHLTVLQDRVKLAPSDRSRFVEACEQAYHFGKGRLSIHFLPPRDSAGKASPLHRFTASTLKFSSNFHCAECDIDYREPIPALFSFNHPVGACPTCRGFGRVISIDYNLALPDRSKTLAEGVVRPWQTGHSAECQQDLMRACRHYEVPIDVPFEKLAKKWQDFVIEGEPDYGIDEEHEWPRAWYGVKGYFRWLESKAYKMHVRVLLSRYRAYTPCPDCRGARFQPESLLYKLPIADSQSPIECVSETDAGALAGITLAEFYALPIRDALQLTQELEERRRVAPADPIGIVFGEVRSRLAFLNEVGLGYLTLDRPTRSLSGGETERVNLTTCLGTRLVNTLFVLDEPSVGLHPRDTERLVHILEELRNAGNTVVVVEHEAGVMRAADQIVDLGPGHGATGGQVVFQGPYADILNCDSLTGQYLSGRKRIEIPERREVRAGQASRLPRRITKARSPVVLALNESPTPIPDRRDACPILRLAHARRHNLKDLTVEIPLGRFVCVTGVSGSGKTTLVREVLLPTLEAELKSQISDFKSRESKASERFDARDERDDKDEDDEADSTLDPPLLTLLSGVEHLGRVVLVDQSILGKTPRSNPAVYIGGFDDIREFFAQSEPAKRRGLNASSFSFNSSQGQCERCRGAGFEKIEMQFLSDVFIRCPDCNGRRYRAHILEVKVEGRGARVEGRVAPGVGLTPDTRPATVSWSIADFLEATVDEVVDFLAGFPDSRPARRARESLKLLQEVGLGYLCLGQPINTLSGGESQRLKLVRHLAGATVGDSLPERRGSKACAEEDRRDARPALFLFDEPTTGLHFEDVRVLLKVFQRLVDAGHSVIVIEHNLDVIQSADWVLDLGPGAGDEGGQLVAQGTPEEIAACEQSHTGHFLRELPGIHPAGTGFPPVKNQLRAGSRPARHGRREMRSGRKAART